MKHKGRSEEWKAKHKLRVDFCRDNPHLDYPHLAHALKKAGLYSQKTSLCDIDCGTLRKEAGL